MKPYDNVTELERVVAEYGGAPYAVAVDSCTNALLLCLKYLAWRHGYKTVSLPRYTYVGVAYAALNAGYQIRFRDEQWSGINELIGTGIIDSARRFRRNMYQGNEGKLYCVSCHWSKILKIGRGGFILTNDKAVADTLRVMRFDGRTAGVHPSKDVFNTPGFHCYLLPEEAARGLMLMASMPDHNDDLPWDGYPDLSQHAIFTGGKL